MASCTQYIEVCLRWNQAMVRNSALGWRAMAHWMAAESMLAKIDDEPERAADTSTLSDLAYRHYLDLMPQQELKAA